MSDLRFADHFFYTQYSLSTFDNCPLKFKKRYLENLKWNSIPEPDIKKRLETGNDFHLLAYRYFMDIEQGLDAVSEELGTWLDNLKKNFKIRQDYIYLPEHKLRMSHASLKLEANFDLLIVKENSIEIWDWKTHGNNIGNNKINTSINLGESLQTIVYLFVLKELSSLVAGKELECERITMYYWQPNPPRIQVGINYSEQLHEQFRHILEGKINKISKCDYNNFDKELYRKHCKFCEFNWCCNSESVDFNEVKEMDDFNDSII